MGVLEVFVVFVISWWIVFLPTLSAGTRSQHEAGAVSPGTDRAAPEKIKWTPKIIIATAGAAAITLMLWLALRFGWLDFVIPRG
jgi:predicted secreted protein